MAKQDIESTSFTSKLSAAIIKYKKPILAALILVVAVIVTLLIVFGVKASKEQALAEEFYVIEKKYSEERMKEEPNYTAVLKDLDAFISGGKSYPEIKALYIRAGIHFENKKFAKAYEDYSEVSSRVKDDNYYKSLAMFGMAASLEEQKKSKEAVSLYTEIWEKFGVESPVSARALFGILRHAVKTKDEVLKNDMAKLLQEHYSYTDYGFYANSLLEVEDKDEEK